MPKISSLKKSVLSGSLWTILQYGSNQALRFVSNVILTRLLEPELFGLMALLTSVRVGLELFSDVGLGHNIIQNERGAEPDFYNTAWTVQIIRGFVLWFMSLLVTLPVAKFYDESRLIVLLPIIGFTTVLDGFTSTSGILLRKQLKLGILFVFRTCLQFINLAAMISWALVNPTIWALISGTLLNAGLGIIGTHFVLPGPPNRLCWNRESLKEIFGFGKWVFVATILFFMANQADRLLLGRLFSFEMLGVYTIALSLANLPRQVLKNLSSQVVFPTVTKLKALPRNEFREKLARPRQFFLLAASVGLSMLSSFGDLLISFLYDSRYESATWIFSILCLGVWFSILTDLGISMLLAFGRPIYNTISYASKLLSIASGIYIGARFFGIAGFVIAVAVSDLCAYLGIQYGLYREKVQFYGQDLGTTLLLLTSMLSFSLIRWSLGLGLPLNNIGS